MSTSTFRPRIATRSALQREPKEYDKKLIKRCKYCNRLKLIDKHFGKGSKLRCTDCSRDAYRQRTERMKKKEMEDPEYREKDRSRPWSYKIYTIGKRDSVNARLSSISGRLMVKTSRSKDDIDKLN